MVQEPGDNIVTPVVGKDLVKNAFILTIVAWIAMMHMLPSVMNGTMH
jgi:preprotein translocase subunit SecF